MWEDLMSDQVVSAERDNRTYFWEVPNLWELSADFPVKAIPVRSLEHFLDENRWFNLGTENDNDVPTPRAVAVHSERIHSADLTYPIILSASGEIMDGLHRLAKAWMLGNETIDAVQFEVDPDPDWTDNHD